MNTQFQPENAQHHDERPAFATQVSGARILALLALLALLTACGTPLAADQTATEPRMEKAITQSKPIRAITKPLPAATPGPTATSAPTATPAATATPARALQPVSIGTNGGEWQFDLGTLEIAAGEDIALTFNNGAKTTLHNWLLISGDDYAAIEVNKAGEQAGQAAGYIPDDARIIARTFGLVKGGQSQTVTFTAPPAGTYVYLCSFPGHFEEGMRGVLTVK
jgi:azurin